MRTLIAAGLAVLALVGCTSVRRMSITEIAPTEAETLSMASVPHIEWSVTNRFRLLSDAVEPGERSAGGKPDLDDESRFYRDLALETLDYEAWFRAEEHSGVWLNEPRFDLIKPNPASDRPFRNYKTRYSTISGSYRCRMAGKDRQWDMACPADGAPDWISDQTRTVLLSIPQYHDEVCAWVVGSTELSGPCGGTRVTVPLNTATIVTGRRAGEAETNVLTETVSVRDVKIVALGDSYSAGEGIPHAQWRGVFSGNRPALWLDPRCHRSLLSAPSLAAAYIARNNPHLSVTLLHYGCSGASIADGVLAPWGYLESDADVKAKASHFAELPAWQGQATARVGGSADAPDVGLSQIEQARSDLAIGSSPPTAPDAVIVSVGGNDIGFAGIIAGLIGPILAPEDLKPGPPDDTYRKVAPFDAAMWSKVSSQAACTDHKLNGIDCMALEAGSRINGSGTTGDIRTLQRQYAALRAGLGALVPDQRRVFITKYPYFVFRPAEPGDSSVEVVEGVRVAGCIDRALDTRPDMVPGFIAWMPWFGLKPGSARRAVEEFQNPLNAAVKQAADDPVSPWTVVESQLPDSVTHGYCSKRRYYNTMIDSYYYQGRKYGPERELGNIEVLNGEQFGMSRGERLIWDRYGPTPCFRRWRYVNDSSPPADEGCITESAEARAQLRQTLPARSKPTLLGALLTVFGRDLGTTGPVHPNLYGHCNYAAAIVTQIVRENPSGITFDPAFEAQVRSKPALQTKDICNPGAWGWRSVSRPELNAAEATE